MAKIFGKDTFLDFCQICVFLAITVEPQMLDDLGPTPTQTSLVSSYTSTKKSLAKNRLLHKMIFNLFLLLVRGGCVLSISPCRPLHTYPDTHSQCNLCVPNRLMTVALWLLSVMALTVYVSLFTTKIVRFNIKFYYYKLMSKVPFQELYMHKDTKIYLRSNGYENAQQWISKKLPTSTCIHTKKMSSKFRCCLPVK